MGNEQVSVELGRERRLKLWMAASRAAAVLVYSKQLGNITPCQALQRGRRFLPRHRGDAGRGLLSYTFWLNVSALCGPEGAFRGCVRGVKGYLRGAGGFYGVSGMCFVSETAQVQLNSGRV